MNAARVRSANDLAKKKKICCDDIVELGAPCAEMRSLSIGFEVRSSTQRKAQTRSPLSRAKSEQSEAIEHVEWLEPVGSWSTGLQYFFRPLRYRAYPRMTVLNGF